MEWERGRPLSHLSWIMQQGQGPLFWLQSAAQTRTSGSAPISPAVSHHVESMNWDGPPTHSLTHRSCTHMCLQTQFYSNMLFSMLSWIIGRLWDRLLSGLLPRINRVTHLNVIPVKPSIDSCDYTPSSTIIKTQSEEDSHLMAIKWNCCWAGRRPGLANKISSKNK